MLGTLSKVGTAGLIALFSLSGPLPQGAEEIAALRREIDALKAQQAAMQKDLSLIKNLLQALLQQRPQAQQEQQNPLENASIAIAGRPAMGSASAKVTLVEVSDYHCPFCRRHTQQVFPQIQKDYVDTGKVRYVFVDYPIAQLHPDAAKAHEAANCAGEQGKFWEMHRSLFTNPPARDQAQFAVQAKAVGIDVNRFTACLGSGKYATPVRESVERIQDLGISGTPTTLVGLTPAGGGPMKIAKVVVGAQSYQAFRATIDAVLSEAK